MRAIAHFSVGVSGMLILLIFLDFDDRHEFLLTFASGYWALVPDFGWFLLRMNMSEAATVWKAIFNSPLGNLFWFAPILDAAEPVNRVFEITGAILLLGSSVAIHYFFNDWDIDATAAREDR